MTRLRHERPPHWGPDPGSVIQVADTTRPYKHVSAEEKRLRSAERRQDEKARVQRVRLKQEYDRLKVAIGRIKRLQKSGLTLSYWDRAALERWREVRAELGL